MQFDCDLSCSAIAVISLVINDLLHTQPYFAMDIVLGIAEFLQSLLQSSLLVAGSEQEKEEGGWKQDQDEIVGQK